MYIFCVHIKLPQHIKLHTLTTHNREWETRLYVYLNWRFGFSLYSVFFDSYIVSKSYCVKQTTNRESDEWNPQSNIRQQIQNKRWDLRIAFEYSSAIYCWVVSFLFCAFLNCTAVTMSSDTAKNVSLTWITECFILNVIRMNELSAWNCCERKNELRT